MRAATGKGESSGDPVVAQDACGGAADDVQHGENADRDGHSVFRVGAERPWRIRAGLAGDAPGDTVFRDKLASRRCPE